jgi:hypothetical protein
LTSSLVVGKVRYNYAFRKENLSFERIFVKITELGTVLAANMVYFPAGQSLAGEQAL